MGHLEGFIKNKKQELKKIKAEMSLKELKDGIRNSSLPKLRSFKIALEKDVMALIAEIKKRAPSSRNRLIKKDCNEIELAKKLEKSGATVISVLTDKKYFDGDIEFMLKIKKKTSIPILRKDFIIDEYQIYESRLYGADAILLIASALSKEELERFVKIARKLQMDCLVEVHTKEDLKRIPDSAEIIGFNNRNLDTLETDILKTTELMREYKQNGRRQNGRLIVSESGIKKGEDVAKLKELGVDAILTGTALMRTRKGIKNKIKELIPWKFNPTPSKASIS